MQHLKVSGAVRLLKWPLGVKWLTLALDVGWVVNTMPWLLYPRKRPCTHCIGGWVGQRAGLDG
jgi:hypothetical protein